MLRIREDRQALVRRVEISRVAVGAALSALAVSYWFVQIVRGDYYFSLSENNRIRAVKITAPRGYVLDRNGATLVENEPAYTLHLYRREARDLEASIDFAVELLGLSREQVASRVERGRREPEFVPIPIAENLGIEEVAAVEARVDRAPGVRHHGLAAPALQARRLGRPRPRVPLRGHARADQGGRRRSTRSATGSARRASRAPTSGCSPEPTASGASSSTRTAAKCRRRNRLEATPGQNLFLTLDLKLQDVAEEYFRDSVGTVVAHGSRGPARSSRSCPRRRTTRTGSRAA